MRLNAPRQITWLLALLLALIAAVGSLYPLPVLSPFAVWIALGSAVLLLLATLFRGL